jgi:chemotaxis protein MotB
MARDAAVNVTIVKRRKVVAAGGHHGGAWKVAYADFVTAMMAFFLLMWLLNVSDDELRAGLADYFSPTIPIYHTSGGGDGPFEGSSLVSIDTLAHDETGAKGDPKNKIDLGTPDKTLWEIEQTLTGGSGDAVEADPLLKHIATRVTDEGLIIEVFDVPGSPLFQGPTLKHNQILERLLAMIGRVLSHVGNPIAVAGHLATGDTGGGGAVGPVADPWTLSSDRAQLVRRLLADAGVVDARMKRVTGLADREPITDAPTDARNRRLEITLLRDFDR